MAKENELITLPTAARECDVPLRTIYWAVNNGLETQDIGGKTFTTKAAVELWKSTNYIPRPRPKKKARK